MAPRLAHALLARGQGLLSHPLCKWPKGQCPAPPPRLQALPVQQVPLPGLPALEPRAALTRRDQRMNPLPAPLPPSRFAPAARMPVPILWSCEQRAVPSRAWRPDPCLQAASGTNTGSRFPPGDFLVAEVLFCGFCLHPLLPLGLMAAPLPWGALETLLRGLQVCGFRDPSKRHPRKGIARRVLL